MERMSRANEQDAGTRAFRERLNQIEVSLGLAQYGTAEDDATLVALEHLSQDVSAFVAQLGIADLFDLAGSLQEVVLDTMGLLVSTKQTLTADEARALRARLEECRLRP